MWPRHKHADLIHQWAEGAEIQRLLPDGYWVNDTDTPEWLDDEEYRIKPNTSRNDGPTLPR